MSNQVEPSVLILYSNPSDTLRLRLDKEHRKVGQVFQQQNIDPRLIDQLHATSTDDLVNALRQRDYEIIQFSGHGSEDGVYLENTALTKSSVISANQIAAILQDTSPNLKVAIFISCFSASSISQLISTAPYLITISGEADDDSSIEFISAFYDSYFRYKSVEKAFSAGLKYLTFQAKESLLRPILSRRATEKTETRVLFQVFPKQFGEDTILVDITDAEGDIDSLDIPRDNFLSLLSRKIRIHRWIFNTPREQAILSVGSYFGIFSWNNANDAVNCHKILRVKKTVDEATCAIWASLIVTYNDHYIDEYRLSPKPVDVTSEKKLKRVIEAYHLTNEYYFDTEKNACLLREATPEQFKVTKSLISANLRMCDLKFHQDDYSSTVMYLESTLSAIHDLLDSLTAQLTE